MPNIPNDLRDKLRRIFNKHDPVGIFMNKKVNFDEYDPEINRLMTRFKRSKNQKEFTSEIHQVFHYMFSGIKIPKNRLNNLAKDAYALLNSKVKR